MNTSQDSPYSVKPDDNPIRFSMNVQDQITMYKDNEKHQKAPPILPFELEQVNQVLGDAFVSLAQLRNILSDIEQKDDLNKCTIHAVKEKIDKVNELILEIPYDLAKIAI